jgi:hypothetical protein
MNAVLQEQPQPAEADLFGQAPALAGGARSHGTACLHFTWTLVHQAEVRMKQLYGHGHHVPVVCIDLEDVGAGHHRVRAEQPFTEETRPAAEALAKQLRKGMTVTVTSGLIDIRLYLPAACISHHSSN